MQIAPLIIIDTAIIGGPGRGIFQLIKGMHERSIDYLLCNFHYPKSKSDEFLHEAKRRSTNLALLHQRNRADPLPLLQLINIVRNKKYTIIQSHGYKSHLLGAIVAKVFQLPWIAFAHGWTAEDKKVQLYHKLDLFLLKYASAVVAVSPQLKETFVELRGAQRFTELIFNAIDPDAIRGKGRGACIRSACNATAQTVLLGCFGRLSFEKGQDILLHAFARIQEKIPDSRLLLLGDGPAREILETLCHDLRIKNKVYFMPHDSYIRDYYQAIDLLVLPSRSEGLPNVALEAMALSVPVLSTKVGAVEEIISNTRNGWIVESNNPSALAQCLHKVLTNREQLKSIGKAGYTSLWPKFCAKARTERILELYETVLTEHTLSSSRPSSSSW